MTLPSRRERVLGGRYHLVEPIGRGGMAVVWLAHDRVLDRGVAVKILSDSSERFRERLRTEATAVGRLRNAHIAHIYDYGETVTFDGQTVPYLVMELVDGEPLSRRLTRETVLAWPDALDIAAQVAAAMAAAHADGLVHRDIKPDNVLLTSDGVKLIDFGISALVGSPDVEEDGQVLGTVAYLAPERLTGALVGPAADVYALGVLLYRMVAGTLPWRVRDQEELLEAHLNVEPGPLPVTGDMPAALAAVCADCLRKEPARRPTAAELAGVLARLSNAAEAAAPAGVAEPVGLAGSVALAGAATSEIVAGAVAAAPVAGPASAGRHPARRAVGALAVVAAGVTLALVFWSGEGGGPRASAGGLPGNVPCVANFAIMQDWGSGFTATLTIVNMGAPVQGWRIAFNFTGDQQVTTGPETVTVTAATRLRQAVLLRQSGVTVSAANPDQTLRRHDSVTLPLVGRYSGANPIPLDYRLNDQQCVAQVSGAAGHPTPPGGTIPPTAGYPGGGATGTSSGGVPIPGGSGSGTTPLPGPPVVPGTTPPGTLPGTPPEPSPTPPKTSHPTASPHPTPTPPPTPDPSGSGGGHTRPSMTSTPTHNQSPVTISARAQ